jgi:hypothetical protein
MTTPEPFREYAFTPQPDITEAEAQMILEALGELTERVLFPADVSGFDPGMMRHFRELPTDA